MTDFSNLPVGTKVLVEATVRKTRDGLRSPGWCLLTVNGSNFGLPVSQARKYVKIVSLPETPEQIEDALRSKLARVTAERDAARDQIRRYREKEDRALEFGRDQPAYRKPVVEADETLDARNKRLAEEMTKLTGLPVTVVDEAHFDKGGDFDRLFRYRNTVGHSLYETWKHYDLKRSHGRKEARQTKVYKFALEDFNRSRELVKEGYKLNFGTAPDLPPDTLVHYVMRNGEGNVHSKGWPVGGLRWFFRPHDDSRRAADIIAYKVVKGEPKFNPDIPPPAGVNRKTLFSHKPGDPCPVHPDTKVTVELNCGFVSTCPIRARDLSWKNVVGYTPAT